MIFVERWYDSVVIVQILGLVADLCIQIAVPGLVSFLPMAWIDCGTLKQVRARFLSLQSA